jgi:hypothetical protein
MHKISAKPTLFFTRFPCRTHGFVCKRLRRNRFSNCIRISAALRISSGFRMSKLRSALLRCYETAHVAQVNVLLDIYTRSRMCSHWGFTSFSAAQQCAACSLWSNICMSQWHPVTIHQCYHFMARREEMHLNRFKAALQLG